MSLATKSLRKAALLVRSLDTESAAMLLAQLSPQEARAVRQAVRELGEIDPEEQAELAREMRRSDAEPATDDGGVELSLNTLEDESQQIPANSHAPISPGPGETSPFGWLEHGDLPTLASMLEREHLSTVAVVLSHLPSERAAGLLSALPPARRAAALERLADLGESDRASLEVIEKSLADWIARQKRQRQLRADRLKAIRQILEHAPRDARDAILAEFVRSDSHLAAEVNPTRKQYDQRCGPSTASARHAGQVSHLRSPRGRNEMAKNEANASASRDETKIPPQSPHVPALPRFEFDQVANLNRQELATLMQQTDPKTLVLALAGGSDEVMRHVIQQLPGEVGRELTRRVNHLSQIRLTDVARAQERIALTAAELTAAGRIGPLGNRTLVLA